MAKGTFATAINCMDGRTQLPVNNYLREHYDADFVDTITEAGPDEIVAEHEKELKSIKKRVAISVEKHGSHVVAIVGHHDCAGNPVDEKTHKKEIRRAMKMVSGWFADTTVIGLWVNKDWEVTEIV